MALGRGVIAARRPWIGTLFCLALALSALAFSREASWRAVRSGELASLLAGQEFADGAHFSYRFGRDGSFSGIALGSAVRGSWRVARGQFCWTRLAPPEEEECYDVEVNGNALRFLRFRSEAFYGALSRRLVPEAK